MGEVGWALIYYIHIYIYVYTFIKERDCSRVCVFELNNFRTILKDLARQSFLTQACLQSLGYTFLDIVFDSGLLWADRGSK